MKIKEDCKFLKQSTYGAYRCKALNKMECWNCKFYKKKKTEKK